MAACTQPGIAIGKITSYYDQFRLDANEFAATVNGYIGAMQTEAVAYAQCQCVYSVDFDHSICNTPGYTSPNKVTAPSVDLDRIDPPEGVTKLSITVPDFDPAPDLDATRETVDLPPPVNLTERGDVDTSFEPVAKPTVTPGYGVVPSSPTLADVIIPTAPTWSALPTFTSTPPSLQLSPPQNTFSWSETAYSSDNLTKLTTTINTWLDGGTGLPSWVWDMIWNRARVNEGQAIEQQVQQINEEWSSRGFTLPQGPQMAQVRRARQAELSTVVTLNREIAIKQADMEVENMRFAMVQGIALEQTLISEYQQRMQRAFEAAKASVELGILVYNAYVEEFNARLRKYQTDAEVYKALLEARVIEVQQYQAQLEAAKTKNEVNETTVRVYSEQVKAWMGEIEAYKTEIEAVNLLFEQDRNSLEHIRIQLGNLTAQLTQDELRVRTYLAKLDGEKIKVDMWQSDTTAYAQLLQAYSMETSAQVAQTNLNLDIKRTEAAILDANLGRTQQMITQNVEEARIRLSKFQSDTQLFLAQVEDNKARSADNVERSRVELASINARETLRLKQFDQQIDQIRNWFAFMMDTNKTMATIYSQLSAGLTAAMDMNLGVQDGTSDNRSWECGT